jgi:hypothetical protein
MSDQVENQSQAADTATATGKKAKVAPVITTVTMDDGRVVEFAGKRKMQKTSTIEQDTVSVRMDFLNGETRTYRIVPELLLKFAAHGAEQKLGDETAGIEDVADMIEAIDALRIRLEKGEWNVTREKSAGGASASGSSILVRALVELSGKPIESIRELLASKTHEEKLALRRNAKLRPIVERMEAEKADRAAKKGEVKIDSDALLDSFTSETLNPSAMGTAAV